METETGVFGSLGLLYSAFSIVMYLYIYDIGKTFLFALYWLMVFCGTLSYRLYNILKVSGVIGVTVYVFIACAWTCMPLQ